MSCACSALLASCLARSSSSRRSSATRPRGGDLGEAPREQEVARVAALDVDDLALEPDLVDVLGQDDLHRHLV